MKYASYNRIFRRLKLNFDDDPPDDFIGTLNYLLLDIVNYRNAQIFISYYFTENTLCELSEIYNITPQAIHQTVLRIENLLTLPENHIILEKGLKTYVREQIDKIKEKTYSAAYKEGYKQCRIDKEFSPSRDALRNMPIEKTNLKIHTRRSLIKAGYLTINDVIKAGPEEISRIEDFGEVSYNDLIHMLSTEYDEQWRKWIYNVQKKGKSK